MLTVIGILVVIALIITILSALTPSKAPLWIAVLILCIVHLIQVLPIGK